MWKYFAGGIVVVCVLAAGLWFSRMSGKTAPHSQAVPQAMATSTFATSTYAVVYPSTFSANESYAYDQISPTKLIHGVKFVIPGTMATGTNLSSYDTGISIEQLPRAKNCTADIYFLDNVHAQMINDNGIEYSVATTSGAGAGNLYEEQVYALVGSHPCTAVRYFIHSTNIGNYDPSTNIREYDRTALMTAFDTIRRSLILFPVQ